MKIGIIGAGIAGLAAGRELAHAGHEVTVIERNRELGGRLATIRTGNGQEVLLDTGVAYLKADTPLFGGFLSELLDQDLLRVWGERVRLYDGEHLLTTPPPTDRGVRYVAPDGMDRIARHLSRWVDLKVGEQVGGLTFIGANRQKKRPWMVNLSSYNTFEADAVIVAAPAPEAYGVLLTALDEVEVFKLVREIDEIHYDPCYAISATYGSGHAELEWDAIRAVHDHIEWISNEGSKRTMSNRSIVVRSTPEAARRLRDADSDDVIETLLREAGDVAGRWIENPEWTELRLWNYFHPRRVINRPFMELSSEDAPLAVIGDYFEGNDQEAAYCSGVKLARHWIDRFG